MHALRLSGRRSRPGGCELEAVSWQKLAAGSWQELEAESWSWPASGPEKARSCELARKIGRRGCPAPPPARKIFRAAGGKIFARRGARSRPEKIFRGAAEKIFREKKFCAAEKIFSRGKNFSGGSKKFLARKKFFARKFFQKIFPAGRGGRFSGRFWPFFRPFSPFFSGKKSPRAASPRAGNFYAALRPRQKFSRKISGRSRKIRACRAPPPPRRAEKFGPARAKNSGQREKIRAHAKNFAPPPRKFRPARAKIGPGRPPPAKNRARRHKNRARKSRPASKKQAGRVAS